MAASGDSTKHEATAVVGLARALRHRSSKPRYVRAAGRIKRFMATAQHPAEFSRVVSLPAARLCQLALGDANEDLDPRSALGHALPGLASYVPSVVDCVH